MQITEKSISPGMLARLRRELATANSGQSKEQVNTAKKENNATQSDPKETKAPAPRS